MRTSLRLAVGCLAWLREPACSCVNDYDDAPCQYEETALTVDAETPWETIAGEDIAALQVPQHGTWRWHPSTDELDIDGAGTEFPATAEFIPDLSTIRSREHVSGGQGVSCDGVTINVDGTLTFTDEQDEVIVSIPITAQRMHMGALEYSATGYYSPISSFSATLHENVDYEIRQIVAEIIWIENSRLHGEFYYNGQSMLTENTGEGVLSLIAEFEADAGP